MSQKFPNLKTRAYKFWCRPPLATGKGIHSTELPQSLWDIAHAMQDYWNTLAEWAEGRRKQCVVEGKLDMKKFNTDLFKDFGAFRESLIPEGSNVPQNLHWMQEEVIGKNDGTFLASLKKIGAARYHKSYYQAPTVDR
jgi:hypothetical protein